MTRQKLNLIPSKKDEIKIAIAGMGKMGCYHLKALQQLSAGAGEDYYKGNINDFLGKIKICGICDIDSSKLSVYKDFAYFDNIETLLSKTSPDILIIATPTNTHKELALAGLNRGIHTFIEKPIITNIKDFNELMCAAEKNGSRLMAGHIERYNPVSIKIVSLLKNIKPYAESYSFIRTQKHDNRINDDIVIDKVIHDLDLSLYFFDSITKIKVDDFEVVNKKTYEIKLSIKHQNGIKGSIFVSWLKNEKDKKRGVEISQGGHTWKGDFVSKQLWVDGQEIKCYVDGMINPKNNQVKDELVDFIASCIDSDALQKTKPLLSTKEMLESTEWLENITKQIYLR